MFDVQNLIDAMEGIAYVLDPEGTIVTIGTRNWNRFASENGGEALIDGEGVIGRSLYDIIAGESVKDSYRRFADAIRSADHPSAVFASRCDSPSVKRSLRLAMTPIGGVGGAPHVLVQSVTLSEEARPPIGLFDFQGLLAAMERDRTRPVLAMCSYCQDVRFPPGSDDETGTWITAEDYYRRGGTSDVGISHGICSGCWDRTEAALGEA